MRPLGTQTLYTDRLLLRRYLVTDADAMYHNWASDAAVTRYLPWQPHPDPEATAQLLQDWCACYQDPHYYHWVLQLQETAAPVGDIAVCALDMDSASATVGYCLGRPWWGQGLMTEALGAVLAFLFTQVEMARVSACYDPRNAASGRVMQKCGMHHHITLPAAGQNNLGVCDEVWYTLSQAEYLAQQRPPDQKRQTVPTATPQIAPVTAP